MLIEEPKADFLCNTKYLMVYPFHVLNFWQVFHWRWERASRMIHRATVISIHNSLSLQQLRCAPLTESLIFVLMTCFSGVSLKSLQNCLTRRWYGAWIRNFTDFVAAWSATSFPFLRRLTRSSGFPGGWKGEGDASTLLWKYFFLCVLQQHPHQLKAGCPEQEVT